MLSRSKSSGHSSFNASAINKKKKPAPPRPPLPSANKLPTSQSFSASSDLKNRVGQRSMSISAGRSDSADLIDFDTPLDKPITQVQPKSQEPPDFKYRVGASIFFVKSPLVNSVSNSSTKSENPFSPPRPSAQALSRTNNTYARTGPQYTTTPVGTKYISKPTIIKPQQSEDQSSNQFKGSLASTLAPNLTASSTAPTSQYTNVPLEWDEPPKKIPLPTTVKPTVIKPVPPPKKPGLGSKATDIASVPKTLPSVLNDPVLSEPKPYYDEPPEWNDFDDDDDDDDDDDFESKPMPSEPPPPPPSDYEVAEWVDNTNRASAGETELYSEPYAPAAGDRAYAIALYDYAPEEVGDLALQAGDLIYLSSKIDDSWLRGTCGGIEGIFPANYVNVVVPLPEVTAPSYEDDAYSVPVDSQSQSIPLEDQFVKLYANIDYDFTAETESDLTLRAGEVVTILGRINEDWLYGEIGECRGQFPATFVSPVPIDLPTLKF